MENVNTNPDQNMPDNGKTVAIVSYITLIGWIVALVMNSNNKTSLGSYHLRQSLGLILLVIVTMFIRIPLFFIPFLGWGLNMAMSVCLLILWILGLVNAANGQEKPLPVIGGLFENWFASVGK